MGEEVSITKYYNAEREEEIFIAGYNGEVGIIHVPVPAGSKLERICKDAFEAIITEYEQAGQW